MNPTMNAFSARLRRFRPVAVLAGALLLSAPAQASWFGVSAEPRGLNLHAGSPLLALPLLGTLGLEGSARGLLPASAERRLALGLTWRDVALPLSPLAFYGTLGLEWQNAARPFLEAGAHGTVLGGFGWRAYLRGNAEREFTAGAGLELRFR